VPHRKLKILVRRDMLPLPSPYAGPHTPTQEKLAEIWRVALSMDRIGINDSYEDLGVDSFLAAVIFSAIEEAFQISLPMATLLTAPTIEQLAVKVDQVVRGAGT
jgi:acyl carrier protein